MSTQFTNQADFHFINLFLSFLLLDNDTADSPIPKQEFFLQNAYLDNDIINDTIINMGKIENIFAQMNHRPKNVRFKDLCMVCDYYFGNARQRGSSHRIYKTPWQGDPRVNIQNNKGKAKAYQVKQVLMAIERLEVNYGTEK